MKFFINNLRIFFRHSYNSAKALPARIHKASFTKGSAMVIGRIAIKMFELIIRIIVVKLLDKLPW